jgi:hypothetical protein
MKIFLQEPVPENEPTPGAVVATQTGWIITNLREFLRL